MRVPPRCSSRLTLLLYRYNRTGPVLFPLHARSRNRLGCELRQSRQARPLAATEHARSRNRLGCELRQSRQARPLAAPDPNAEEATMKFAEMTFPQLRQVPRDGCVVLAP